MGRKSIDDIRKPQILEHFRKVVNEEGIHKASVVKIAKNMGVSPNLVLHYFSSKEAMVAELFDLIMDQYFSHLSQAISSVPNGPLRLKTLIKTMFGSGKNRELLSEKSYYAFYYLSLFNEQMRFQFNRKYSQFTSILISEIESCIPSKGVSKVDVTRQAELLLAMFEGFTFKANIINISEYFDEFGDYFIEKACILFQYDHDGINK